MTRDALTVIIPAHDEAAVIAATLGVFADRARADEQVLVVCNACRDATAAVARAALPTATVIETPVGGKANAINLGLAAAGPGPVLVLDADVVLDRVTIDALAAVLREPGVAAASPRTRFELAGTPRIVRDYYRVFAMHRYQATGVGGAGVYGISAAGRERLGLLPPVLSDDDYVRHFFPIAEQRRVSADADGRAVFASVKPPATVGDLVRIEARWRAGDRAAGATRSGAALPPRGDAIAAWRESGAGIGALASYVGVKLSGRAMLALNRLRGRADLWHRDDRARLASATPSDPGA